MSAPPQMKKTKTHTIATATADDSASIDVCSITCPKFSVPAALATTTVDPDDSELTLTALLEQTSFDDSPDAGEILPDQHSKVSFMEKLRASFDEQKESVAHSTPAISATVGTSESSSNNTTDLGGILRKKQHSGRLKLNHAYQFTLDDSAVNHKGTVGQFALYWDNLDAVAKKGYDDRSKLVKAISHLRVLTGLDVQETFYDAFRAEQVCQAGLMTQLLFSNDHHAYPRNIGLELLVLQAKMHCAKAEVDLYTTAIENACECDFSDSTSTLLSSSEFIPPPRPDELCYYGKDHDTDFDNLDDLEFD
ncbi:hypothetical protein DFH29DRAFT_879221 [Suillus ampliporus]|nr:hypothetical protein DFH29DRAFT_879221 [Suillus ampliporus]